MSADTIIIVSGLAAFLAAYAAVRDSEGGCRGEVGPLRWSFSDSWASTSAALAALVFSLLDAEAPGPMLGFGVLLLTAPLIYKGLSSGGGGASKRVFLIASTTATWSTFTILWLAALRVPGLLETLPLLPAFAVYAALALALAGAFISACRSLSKAAAGDPSEAWTLP